MMIHFYFIPVRLKAGVVTPLTYEMNCLYQPHKLRSQYWWIDSRKCKQSKTMEVQQYQLLEGQAIALLLLLSQLQSIIPLLIIFMLIYYLLQKSTRVTNHLTIEQQLQCGQALKFFTSSFLFLSSISSIYFPFSLILLHFMQLLIQQAQVCINYFLYQ